MSKQEVIEIIYQAMRKEYLTTRAAHPTFKDAEKVYDRIAPLMVREFPEEEVRQILSTVRHSVTGLSRSIARDTPGLISWGMAYLKRLFEGQQDKPKGTCRACGGTKKVPIPRKSLKQENKYWEDCPDCGGTGEERRSGDERRRQVPITLEYGPSGFRMYYLDPCMTAWLDRRIQSDRRKK